MSDQDARTLRWPLTLDADGHLVTLPRDSPQDIEQCLMAVGRTRPGDRWDEPDRGLEPLEFAERPIPTEDIERALIAGEPRAEITVTEQPATGSVVEQATARIQIELENRADA